MNTALRIAKIGRECVACGCCITVCPKGAVAVEAGVRAKVDAEKCVGCGRCAGICPAAVIAIEERKNN